MKSGQTTERRNKPAGACWQTQKRLLRLAFVHMPGRLARLPEVAREEAPTEFFYGGIELARAGHQVSHYEIRPAPGAQAIKYVFDLPRRLKIGPAKTDGHSIYQALQLCRELNTYDCVVATAGKIAFALAFCAFLGKLAPPILGIQCGMLNFPQNRLRRLTTGFLLNRMQTMLFGEGEMETFVSYFNLKPGRVTVNQFGVDAQFWTPCHERGEIVLSIGNDGRRDYETLLQVAPEIAAPIHIVTKHQLPKTLPPNVTWHRGSWNDRALTDVALRELYHRARCVVIPLRASLQPSGQSVALQAMACARPVVLTDTAGLWSRELMLDEKNVLFCRGGDSQNVGAQIRRLLNDPDLAARLGHNGRETVCAHFSIESFACRVEFLARKATEV